MTLCRKSLLSGNFSKTTEIQLIVFLDIFSILRYLIGLLTQVDPIDFTIKFCKRSLFIFSAEADANAYTKRV